MMKLNENYFLKTPNYIITNGYYENNYYGVIIFNEVYKECEFCNLYKKIKSNMKSFDSMFNININGEEKTIIVQCIENKEKIFIENEDIKVMIGINNNNKSYIRSELPIKIENDNIIYCYDCFTSDNCPFKDTKNVEIKNNDNKTSIIRVF